MVSAKQLLEELKDKAMNKKFGLHLSAFQRGNQAEQALKKTKEMFADKELFNRLEQQMKNLNDSQKITMVLDELSRNIIHDISQCTLRKWESKLSQIELGFLPTGIFDAFCVNQDSKNQRVDGFVICISQGLYLSLQILVKAMILENINGDLIEYRKTGTTDYQSAIALFLTPDYHCRKALFFKGMPAEIQGELAYHQHSISTMILKFVALHEFGHIINDDLNILSLHSAHFYVEEDLQNEATTDYSVYWALELKADEFALNSLCSHLSDSTGIWANFSAVYLFFYFLSDLEVIKKKPLSPSHPPAKYRAKTLLKYMTNKYGENNDAKANILWIQNATKRWYSEIGAN